MGINDTLKNFVNRWKERKTAYKEYEQNQKIANTYEERRLSHDERVLNKLLEQNRQAAIKKQLEFEIVKRKNQDKQKARTMLGSNKKLWSDNSLSKTKNIFKNNKSILTK